MDIHKYTAYFHDGSVELIDHQNNHIELILESAEIDPDDIEDKSILSSENTIKIKLNINEVISITENGHKMGERMKIKYDDAEIFRLQIEKHKVKLCIGWSNYFPKPDTNDYSRFEIEAKKIECERIE